MRSEVRKMIARGPSVLLVPLILLLAPTAAGQQVQSLEHDTNTGDENSLVQVDADTYALAYAGGGLDGFLKTFTISSSGSVPVTLMSFSVD